MATTTTNQPRPTVYLLDYGAGNVRSLMNAISYLGHEVIKVEAPEDLDKAHKLIFPGVGNFGAAMDALEPYREALLKYLKSDRPFFGICVGMQSLFEGSEESPSAKGLGFFKGNVCRFDDASKSVPHMGWNTCHVAPKHASVMDGSRHYYFVHSYAVPLSFEDEDVLSWTDYNGEKFVSAVKRGNVMAAQFHPEKSGWAGLALLKSFLDPSFTYASQSNSWFQHGITKRVIACLDVRANDQNWLVVTKGDQYDVREKDSGRVRDLGDPTELAAKYFELGADEICFLNITSFRNIPLKDVPMIQMLKDTSKKVFVPLTIGGGIRDVMDPDGSVHSAVDVAGEYFRAGADKVSIGSDAVYAAEAYYANGSKPTGTSSIEAIARKYGRQAVVISVDPKRVYVSDPSATTHHCIRAPYPGPHGETYCWYQCTVKGGREARDLDVYQLAKACEALGAGELLVNCMDQDGTKRGFDLALLADVKAAVRIPVVASSGAGTTEHFVQVFKECDVEAALAAGIFHREEVRIEDVKWDMSTAGIPVRREEHLNGV